nr:phosphodiesterase [Prevotella sp.]
MKYLIISDIHGSLPRLNKALNFYDNNKCDMLIILGDILNYGPRNSLPEGLDAKGIADTLNKRANDIVAIRGNCDSEVDQMLLNFPIMQTYMILVDEGKKLMLTHGHVYNKDNMPNGQFDVFFYGHTHLWELEKTDETTFCNTGSITFPKGGKEPTIVTYENGLITVYNLDGKELKTLSI